MASLGRAAYATRNLCKLLRVARTLNDIDTFLPRFDMAIDIYTKSLIATASDEHIVLNALGGRWKPAGLLDKTTNDIFGGTIDSALSRFVDPIRIMLNARTGDGQEPPKFKGATTSDGMRFNVLPGGKPELALPKIEVTDTGGKIRIEGRVRSHAELRSQLRRTAKKYGISMEAIEKAACSVEEQVPMLHFQMALDDEGRRCIAKMVCNLLGACEPNVFAQPGFDAIRGFVLLGGDPRPFVAPNTNPVDINVRRKGIGPLDHVLVVRGRAETGVVDGLVALFGHIQFCVRLGLGKFSKSFAFSYRVDQLGGLDRRNDRRDVTLMVRDFQKIAVASSGAQFEHMRSAFHRVFAAVAEQVEHKHREEMIQSCLVEALGSPDGQPITEKQIDRFSNLLAERFVRDLQRRGLLEQYAASLKAKGLI